MMEKTEKIGFAEWCKKYREILSEDELDSYVGDFLSDIDFDLHQNPFMANCCDYKKWKDHVYYRACAGAKAAFRKLWKMYEQDTQESGER